MPIRELRNYVDGAWNEPAGRDLLDVEKVASGGLVPCAVDVVAQLADRHGRLPF